VVGEWSLHHGNVETNVADLLVEAGDTIDFVVDFAGELTWDEFAWAPALRLTPPEAPDAQGSLDWDAARDFDRLRLDPWVRYAQVLLLSNEFVYVD
jgi:hypothetical protein